MKTICRMGVPLALIALAIGCGRVTAQPNDRSNDRSRPPTPVEQSVVESSPEAQSGANRSKVAPFGVTTPVDGASVSISEVVRGTSPHSGNHYIIVIAESAPTVRWVQNGPATLVNGVWAGSAQFGEGNVGIGKYFLLRCLVTNADLPTGALDAQAIPPDAIESKPVRVKRTK